MLFLRGSGLLALALLEVVSAQNDICSATGDFRQWDELTSIQKLGYQNAISLCIPATTAVALPSSSSGECYLQSLYVSALRTGCGYLGPMPINPPPVGIPASNAVFNATASVTISAPQDSVWGVLVDFASYGEWNPFVRAQHVSTGPIIRSPLPDSALDAGLYLSIGPTNLPPTMGVPKSVAYTFEKILVVEGPSSSSNSGGGAPYRVSWELDEPILPKWLLSAVRWQVLTGIEGGQTRYDTWEVYSGPLAYVVKWVHEDNLNEGFRAMGEALKTRTEGGV
ncbi:hypothetical protein D9611_011768 [Ephemerocybe angulata]|uniref:Uncharacterized protein n=1 Tax=Ephemerocybe angulata TaxID=980116 RepID=A0A8H5FFL4_9AGAR|nr:hypothetical protein D9611_011768 [Tulosesus angulatus]